MWQFIALMLTIFGAVLIYLTNKNQNFTANPLAKFWRLFGFICGLLALFVWLQLHVTSSAIFTWLFTSSVALICIPLLSLHKIFRRHKGDV
jgi:hypothetical protein